MNRKLFALLSVFVLASMLLASCAGGFGAQPAAVQIEGLEEADFAPVKYEAPNCDYGGEFKSIEAVDELTVKVTLCVADPAFPSKIAFTSFGIQPKEYLEFTGGAGDLLEKPIGTGPYYVSQWERGNQLVFTRYDGYWGEPAMNKTLVFRWGTESAQRLLELQSGTVDGIDNVGEDDFATVEGDSNLQLIVRPPLNIMYFGFNNTYPPFDNEKVRQAIAMGIDRQRIVDNFYAPGSEVASHFTPCSIPNGCVGEE
jgi:peptide/nickel transport system substrate-binding protein